MLFDLGIENGDDQVAIKRTDLVVFLAQREVRTAIFDEMIAFPFFFPTGEETFLGEQIDKVCQSCFKMKPFKLAAMLRDDPFDYIVKDILYNFCRELALQFF